MTTQNEPYRTSRAVEAAIKDAAKKAAVANSALDINTRIQLEYFNRFLSRIFSEGPASEWVLKGGVGILARIPSTRSTRDIDLYRQGFTIDQALADLKRLAAIDLGDHFRFEFLNSKPTISADTQPYTDGYRVTFNIFIGVAARGQLNVDLVVGAGITDQVFTVIPATVLDLPGLASSPYRLYPVVDQIADKVCATMGRYEGRASSREKDLVDLVVFALTHDIEGDALSLAIETERNRRQMAPFTEFFVPSDWGPGYAKLSRPVPHCANYWDVKAATKLVSRLVNPAINGEASRKHWSQKVQSWI